MVGIVPGLVEPVVTDEGIEEVEGEAFGEGISVTCPAGVWGVVPSKNEGL